MDNNNDKIVQMLQKAYMMELETIDNYLANSVYLDGIQAEEVKKALASDITEELGHATRLANRIKQLGGRIPGSLELDRSQTSLQPPDDSTNVRAVVEGVLEAELEGIAHYRDIIRETDGKDYVTQDLVIGILAEEEEHRTQFEGFRAGFESFAHS